MTRGALLLFAGQALGACALPARPAPAAARASAPLEAGAPAPRPATLRRAEGRLAVRLTSLAGRDEIVVHDPALGELLLTRRGELVHARGHARGEWLLAPAPGAAGLRVDARTYPGELRVRAGRDGGLEVDNLVDLEDYVAGVVAAELVVWSAPDALLEAQAVASRSWAVAELDHRARAAREPYLRDDTRDQVYAGLALRALEGPEGTAVRARVRAAVERTRGRVLAEAGRVLDARFHASCGGHTARGALVFPESGFASLRAVACAPCREAPEEPWSTTLAREELARLAERLGAGAPLRALEPVEVDDAGRWLRVALEGAERRVVAPFTEVRAALGVSRLPGSLVLSTWPHPGQPLPGGLLVRGRGRGHGVGLCQRGARLYAERGWSAARILDHYYPGAALVDGR